MIHSTSLLGRISLNSRILLRVDNSQEELSRRRGRTKMSQMDGYIASWIVLMEVHFEEEKGAGMQRTGDQSRSYGPELCFSEKVN